MRPSICLVIGLVIRSDVIALGHVISLVIGLIRSCDRPVIGHCYLVLVIDS